MPRSTASKSVDTNTEILNVLKDLKAQLAISQYARPRFPWDPAPDFIRPPYDPMPPFRPPYGDPMPPFGYRAQAYPGALDARRLNYELAMSHLHGPVADPGPEIMLDRRRLIQLRLRQLEVAKVDLQKQIDLLETERDLLGQELKDMK
jgi:hypothetical protein